MKRNPFLLTIAAVLSASVALLAGCEEPGPVRVQTVTMKGTLYLIEGESAILGATVHPADATNQLITWQIEDPEVISYDQATMQLTGLKVGSSAIYATAGGKYAQCEVTVLPPWEDILGNFPDAELRRYMTDYWDRDKNGMISLAEAEQVNNLDLQRYTITSLEGIELLPNLIRISATSYRGETLDLSGNIRLKELSLNNVSDDQGLLSLDVSGCTALKVFSIYSRTLTTLDISGTALTEVSFGDIMSNLKTVKAENCTLLERFSCHDMDLTSLDLSGCTALSELSFGDVPLTSLDLSGCSALTDLRMQDGSLSTLDLSGCTALINLNILRNALTSLDLSGCPELLTLWCPENNLTSLDITGCPSLTECVFIGNPGQGGKFVVKAWFDNDNVPKGPNPGVARDEYIFSEVGWFYDGEMVTIEYQKVI